jgi:uncharacterized Zn finger protein
MSTAAYCDLCGRYRPHEQVDEELLECQDCGTQTWFVPKWSPQETEQ